MKQFIFLLLIIFISTSVFSQGKKCCSGDTINQIDANKAKQGYWVKCNDAKTMVLEEGRYTNNKKEGVWRKYFDNGKIKSEIVYLNNNPDGFAKFYYENGGISEEGIWKGSKWVGKYKFYHENGKPSYEWNYSQDGKRTGVQKYYHENGNIMIEGEWTDGKESGVIKEYYADGKLKAEKNFADGKLDEASVKTYSKAVKAEKEPEIKKEEVIVKEEATEVYENLGEFSGNGLHKLYSKDKRIEKEGEFRNGKLINGKRYIYNKDKKLEKVLFYKNGVLIDTSIRK